MYKRQDAVDLDALGVEAQAFYGWAVWQVWLEEPEGESRDQLLAIATEHLATAVDLGPDDASANRFYGIVLFRGQQDAVAAIPYLERAVELAGDQAPPMLSAVLDEARTTVSGSDATTSATTTASSTTTTEG